MAISKEQISRAKQRMEWKNDPVKFAESCCYLPTTGGDELVRLYEPQKRVLRDFYKNHSLILLKSRQIGFSTLSQLIVAHLVLFYDNLKIGILSRDGNEASDFNRKVIAILDKIQEDFPWIHPGYGVKNAQSFILSNGSCLYSSAISQQNPGAAFRGKTISLLIIDEAAHIPRIEEAWTGVSPALVKAQQVSLNKGIPFGTIILSTPNKKSGIGQWYYRMWSNSITDPNSLWKNYQIHWTEIPDFKNDPNWYPNVCQLLGSDPRKIAQELDMKFIDADNSMFDVETQEYLNEVKNPADTQEINLPGRGKLYIFDKAKLSNKRFYMIGVDTASASGTDNSVIEVIDYITMKQVMEFVGKLEPLIFADVVRMVSDMVPRNIIIVENSGGYGLTILNSLMLDSKKTYNVYGQYRGEGATKKFVAGLSTNVKTRPMIAEALYNFITDDKTIIQGEALALELLSLVTKNNKIQADSGFRDDRALAFAFPCYVRKYDPEALYDADFQYDDEEEGEVNDKYTESLVVSMNKYGKFQAKPGEHPLVAEIKREEELDRYYQEEKRRREENPDDEFDVTQMFP